jgi:hypothetical protein
MFLRSKRRFKNGKWHRCWSVAENRLKLQHAAAGLTPRAVLEKLAV